MPRLLAFIAVIFPDICGIHGPNDHGLQSAMWHTGISCNSSKTSELIRLVCGKTWIDVR